MFRLEKVEINGFKSFHDPAEIVFPDALTAVVGPNGCGKSNICDAIIWVLGETRASHIRGGKMEDVIFQGSDRRRALGMGEVILTLSTDNGHPAAVEGKLRIHRRVFRTGESEFRLNEKRVRMKDISDILMDTGLGVRNYSVMEQGKIDLILSNKPQDRRRLIEEAAGITSYKNKRRAAEIKLEETQANLLRIDDTLAEMTRSLNSLKRQASKARRHAEIASRLSSAKRSLYAGRIAAAKQEAIASEAGWEEAKQHESEASAKLQLEEAQLAEKRHQLSRASMTAGALRDEIGRLNAEVERVRTFLEESEKSLADLIERIDTSGSQVEEIGREISDQQRLLDEKSGELEAATLERNRLRELADDLEAARQDKADAVRSHESTIASSREALMRTIARISEARNQVHQLEIAVEKCEFYLSKLSDTSRKVVESRDTARQQAERWDERVRLADEELTRLNDAARAAIAERNVLEQQHESVRESLAQARDVISQTTYQIDSLRTLLTTLETQDEEVRRQVLELMPHASSAAEAIRAAEGFETALDTILREVTRAVVVEDSGRAIEAIRRLHETGAGRGAFINLDFRPETDEAPGGNVASYIVGDGAIPDAVRAAVPDAYIVDTIDEALAGARRRPHATFVTRGGDLVRGSLVIGGKKGESRGVFAIKRQLADLEQTLSEEESRASGIAQQLIRLEEELRRADDDRIVAQERVRQAENHLREMKSGRERAAAELERFEKDFEVTVEEQALYEEEKAQLLERRDLALEELRGLEATERETQQTIHDTEEALKTARAEFDEATEVAGRGRVDLEAAAGHVHAIQREHENLAKIVHSLRSRHEALTTEREVLERKRAETAAGVDQARADLDGLTGRLGSSTDERVTVETSVAELEAAVQNLEEQSVASREAWNASREAFHEAERRLDHSSSAIDMIREQIQLDLHVGIESLADVEPPSSDEEREQLEEEVATLTEKIEKLGPVNVLAIEEYDEIEERERFLRTQRDDLVQSIDSLRSTIRKINVTSRDLFREAFATVNKQFTEIFTALFGGGRAEMSLLDEEDLLESGIELVAQPPGKKTQSIALLSGGERALTALALLFAIFRFKPSPFCILDEVDAPLDEINNERFVRLLREMSGDTQFVVITHSKRTMEAADVLYGVTMEEAGCSKLVSVSFADVEA